MVKLEGRSYREQPYAVGVYHRRANGTLVYWVKDGIDYWPRAIWFSQISGYWLVGSLEDLGSSISFLKSTSLEIQDDSNSFESPLKCNLKIQSKSVYDCKKCSVCDHTSSRKENLTEHIYLVHNGRIFHFYLLTGTGSTDLQRGKSL